MIAMKYPSIYTFLAVLGGTLLATCSDRLDTVSKGSALSLDMGALVIRHASEQRHLRRLVNQAFCDALEEADDLDALALSCDCNAGDETLTCDSSRICDEDNICFTAHYVVEFTGYEMDSIETCMSFTVQKEEYRHVCLIVNVENGQYYDCETYFVEKDGVTRDCDSCRICNGNPQKPEVDIDCSNIFEEETTDGCIGFDDTDENFFSVFGSSAIRGSLGAAEGLVVALLFFGMHRD
jgi:hypothetical protein